MIYTYGNCIPIFLQLYTWSYIDTATLYQLSCRWTRDDIYIPQLYINFPADEHVMIYTYRNLISIFQQMNTWWYIHTATLYQLSCRWTRDDIYIPQLYITFSADEHLMIYTYRNFILIFQQINTWWYIHTATLYPLSCRWTRDNKYTYRNFISTFLHMNTWWYIYTATLYQLFCRWTPDDMYIPKLNINFSAVVLVIIYTYRNFISIF